MIKPAVTKQRCCRCQGLVTNFGLDSKVRRGRSYYSHQNHFQRAETIKEKCKGVGNREKPYLINWCSPCKRHRGPIGPGWAQSPQTVAGKALRDAVTSLIKGLESASVCCCAVCWNASSSKHGMGFKASWCCGHFSAKAEPPFVPLHSFDINYVLTAHSS